MNMSELTPDENIAYFSTEITSETTRINNHGVLESNDGTKKKKKRKYTRKNSVDNKIWKSGGTPPNPWEKILLRSDEQGSSKILRVMRNMCEIRKMERENADRVRNLCKRLQRKLGHVFTNPAEFYCLQNLVNNMSKQSETISTKTDDLVASAQQILHHEFIARHFALSDIQQENDTNYMQ